MEQPAHFTIDNEPYLGLEALYVFDTLITSAMKLSSELAAKTQAGSLTELQRAAAQVVPQGLNICLSIRELIRQGHLFSALVLIRSLVERAAIISYLRRRPESLPLWERGWKHGERPSLVKMLIEAHPTNDTEGARKVCETLNHLVHGDPYAAEFNLVSLGKDGWAMPLGVWSMIQIFAALSAAKQFHGPQYCAETQTHVSLHPSTEG